MLHSFYLRFFLTLTLGALIFGVVMSAFVLHQHSKLIIMAIGAGGAIALGLLLTLVLPRVVAAPDARAP